ncbi:uncharacterized protein LOC143291618 [Babylonia areolata]|uniref:uncharacterized protein LOC143291618 n=1 Tax=Babylonia areolata TaxID=304850 RepID=UPI003FD520DC
MAASPLAMLIVSAVVLGGLATLVVVVAISVDSWQDITFDQTQLQKVNSSTFTVLSLSSTTQFYKVVETTPATATSNASVTESVMHSSTNGLWRTCDHLSDAEREAYKGLLNKTATTSHCFIFVMDYNEDSEILTTEAKQIARLHNSAASCYIVVLIDLTSAVVVGLVGIFQKQVASCMVTGVLYFMAALFGVFGLAMFHTKHYYETYECKSFDSFPKALCDSRQVEILYGVALAWIGVAFCLMACTLWLVFARALRVIMAKTML